MKKIKFIICFLLFASSGFSVANQRDNATIYQDITTITSKYQPSYLTFVSTMLLTDGDFSKNGGHGNLDEFTTTIKTDNPNATGNLHGEVYFLRKSDNCWAKAPLNFPLKVINNKIVLPTGVTIIKDNISYSSEQCLASVNIKYFEITINKPDSRYVMHVAAAGK